MRTLRAGFRPSDMLNRVYCLVSSQREAVYVANSISKHFITSYLFSARHSTCNGVADAWIGFVIASCVFRKSISAGILDSTTALRKV